MGILIRYLNCKDGYWSRVDLENGDPVWISVAHSGVIVKKSKMGLLGGTLYQERSNFSAAKTARALDAHISKYVTPMDMTNPVLRAFTQVALECKSADEFAARLNKAVKEK
jgi:hypothetical protein